MSPPHSAHDVDKYDSEDDPDYVPPQDDPESSDDELAKEQDVKLEQYQPTEEEELARKRERETLWAEFQASVLTPKSTTETPPSKTVKIEKKYLYAGKEIKEVVEVPEDSPDAKKWPLWVSPEQRTLGSPSAQQASIPPSADTTFVSSDITGGAVQSETPKQSGKRPGPRKPRTSLAALPTSSSQTAKKLTTLDKSAMDWQKHISLDQTSLKDELEANRRGGGYLEKVEFLKRVEERREETFEASKSSKRRRI